MVHLYNGVILQVYIYISIHIHTRTHIYLVHMYVLLMIYLGDYEVKKKQYVSAHRCIQYSRTYIKIF